MQNLRITKLNKVRSMYATNHHRYDLLNLYDIRMQRT